MKIFKMVSILTKRERGEDIGREVMKERESAIIFLHDHHHSNIIEGRMA